MVRGQAVAQPRSITPDRVFHSQVHILDEKEGGPCKPFHAGFGAQLHIRTAGVAGVITLPQDVEMPIPGDNGNLRVELMAPVAMQKGAGLLSQRVA